MIFPAHFRTTTNARKGWIGVITLSHEHRSVWKHFQRKRHEVKWWQWPRHCHPFGHLIAIHFPPFIVNEQRMTPVVKVRFAVQLALNFHFKRIFYNPVIICECYNMAQWVQTPEESSIYGLFFYGKCGLPCLKIKTEELFDSLCTPLMNTFAKYLNEESIFRSLIAKEFFLKELDINWIATECY